MNRRAFVQACAALGGSLPFFNLLGCASEGDEGLYWDFDVAFEGKVVIIGAGAAGLAAGYMLDRYGIAFEILEAAQEIGGRVRRASDFVDFPIDVGAEWIHEDPAVLATLIDDPSAEGDIDVLPYSPESVANYQDGLVQLNVGANYYSEYKFKSTTWFGFLEEHIAQPIADRIHPGRPVVSIDRTGDRIVLTDADGARVEADRVLVTVPIKVLQAGLITFVPELPRAKVGAIDQVHVPDAIKVFLEFDEAFYPDLTLVGALTALDKIYYNAAFRKDTERNVLALFFVSDSASALTDLESDEAIVDAVLAELDTMFGGQATPSFVQGLVQNWSKEPYILGAYSYDFGDDEGAVIRALNEPVDDQLYFAGEALSADNGATVPGAMQSAYAAVKALLETA